MTEQTANATDTAAAAAAANNTADTTGGAAGEDTAGGGAAGDTAPKQKPWFQVRIDKLVNEKYTLAQEAENAKARLAEVLSAAGAPPAPTPGAAPTGTTAAPAPSAALTEAEINRRADERANNIASRRMFDDACNKVFEAGEKDFPDFATSLESFKNLGGLPPAMLEVVIDLPEGHKVLHHLSKNPDEASRILGLSPTRMAVEMARLEASIAKPKPLSNAPPPVKTIEGRGKSDPSLEDKAMPMDQWLALRNQQLEDKRKLSKR